MKIKYETKPFPYPKTGPGSKWMVLQINQIQTGKIVTWYTKLDFSIYDFYCEENRLPWSISANQVRPATIQEILEHEKHTKQ